DRGGHPPPGRSQDRHSAKPSYTRACRAGAGERPDADSGGRRSARGGGSESPRRRRAPRAIASAGATARTGSIATASLTRTPLRVGSHARIPIHRTSALEDWCGRFKLASSAFAPLAPFALARTEAEVESLGEEVEQ